MPVLATPATIEMTSLTLRDSARLQVFRQRASEPQARPRRRAKPGSAPYAGRRREDPSATPAHALPAALPGCAWRAGHLAGIRPHARLGQHPASGRGGRQDHTRRLLGRSRAERRAHPERLRAVQTGGNGGNGEGFMGSLHEFEIAHRNQEPAEERSADGLVRESFELGSRGQSCPRAVGRFMRKEPGSFSPGNSPLSPCKHGRSSPRSLRQMENIDP
jgi:hypothetical protein